MSIFRVEKNTNYTVISNYHLRDRNLSLKTIGLLSLILSLPDDWDYSEAGLAAICKDGKDSISSGLKELEKYGYLERERERGEDGRIYGMIYKIYEVPRKNKEQISEKTKNNKNNSSLQYNSYVNKENRSPQSDSPSMDFPLMDIPSEESPIRDEPISEKQAQIIKDISNTEEINKDQPIYLSNNLREQIDVIDGLSNTNKNLLIKQKIYENINYSFFEFKKHQNEDKFEKGELDVEAYEFSSKIYDLSRIDQVVGYMMDVLTSINDDPIKIGDELISRAAVREKLMKIEMMEMQKVVLELNTNPSIKNPKKYAISMLYNS